MSDTTTDTQTVLTLAIEDNLGYSPRQVAEDHGTMTLYALHRLVTEAMEEYGEDALIVTDNGQRYGARYGTVDIFRDTLEPVEGTDDDEGGYY